MAKLFFSYSHRDEALRDELEIHLSGLKRQGVIETWHDRRIGAGKEFGSAISKNLEEAEIILLLVSPYFIASDYCYDIEVIRALERHEAREARVIPVILHPCDWQSLPFGKLLATPTDGKPISQFPNQHDAFLEVALAIRKAAEEINIRAAAKQKREVPEKIKRSHQPKVVPEIRSSNLMVKKTFTDRDKDRFLGDAFEYMANFFEGSLSELEARNPEFRLISGELIKIILLRLSISLALSAAAAKYGLADGVVLLMALHTRMAAALLMITVTTNLFLWKMMGTPFI